jgi:pimeloyl-ACP methyl ester carboxylesterase
MACQQIPGPVLAVGHSYGGAMISNADADTANVVGLVFVNASLQMKASDSAKWRTPRRTAPS